MIPPWRIKTSLLQGKLRSALSFYVLKKQNVAIITQTGTTTQTGDQQSKGLEATVSGEPGAGLKLRAVYGYTLGKLTNFTEVDPITGAIDNDSGNQPAWVPHQVFNAWVSHGLLHNTISAALGVRAVSSSFVDEANTAKVGPYGTLDANFAYQREHWKATVNLKNLTGTTYFTRAASETAVVPAGGFSVTGGVHLTF